MQMDTSVYCYIDDYVTANCYHRTYAEPIYLIHNNDKPCDDHRELRMRPPISKKWPGRPHRKRIESQAFDIRDMHCSRCHEPGHSRRSCNVVSFIWLVFI